MKNELKDVMLTKRSQKYLGTYYSIGHEQLFLSLEASDRRFMFVTILIFLFLRKNVYQDYIYNYYYININTMKAMAVK